MNSVNLIGRLARNPQIFRKDDSVTARYTLAVDRRGSDAADFIPCVSWGKTAEFAEKYLKQGMKIAAEGRVRSGSYTKEDGEKVYTVDIAVNHVEFCEKKAEGTEKKAEDAAEGFLNVPEGLEDELFG